MGLYVPSLFSFLRRSPVRYALGYKVELHLILHQQEVPCYRAFSEECHRWILLRCYEMPRSLTTHVHCLGSTVCYGTRKKRVRRKV
jgi:hypothetical protein